MYFVAFTWFCMHTNVINYGKSNASGSHRCLLAAQAPKTDNSCSLRSMDLVPDPDLPHSN